VHHFFKAKTRVCSSPARHSLSRSNKRIILPEEMEAMIRAGGFDEFGQTRTRQFWERRVL
jgi:DNA polymerase III alpha subunit